MDRQQFARRLKQARISAEKSAPDVAAHLEMKVKAFYHWETGVALPDVLRFKAMARFYGVNPDLILSGAMRKQFTEELEMAIARLDVKDARRLEAVMRAHLGMDALPVVVKGKTGTNPP